MYRLHKTRMRANKSNIKVHEGVGEMIVKRELVPLVTIRGTRRGKKKETMIGESQFILHTSSHSSGGQHTCMAACRLITAHMTTWED